jgi:anti-sigma B factor antagonist
MPPQETGSHAQPGSREGASGLDIVRGRDGTTVVLELAGELDLHTVVSLRMRLAEAVAQGGSDVLVDLTGITFIDSMGLATLLNALRRLTRAGRRLLVVSPGGPALRMLRLTRLDSTFDVYESASAALASGPPPHALAA